jgi:hypothetical protein
LWGNWWCSVYAFLKPLPSLFRVLFSFTILPSFYCNASYLDSSDKSIMKNLNFCKKRFSTYFIYFTVEF